MLFKNDTNEPLWGKYTADTINIAGFYYPLEIGLDEDQIDELILQSLSEDALATLYKAPANGRYRPCAEERS
jgi:hypothetical protein